MIAAMLAAKQLGADQSEVLFAANSGDVTGDRSRVVGYMAAALWASDKKKIDSSVRDFLMGGF